MTWTLSSHGKIIEKCDLTLVAKFQFIQIFNVYNLTVYHLYSYSMRFSLSRCNYRPAPLLEPTHFQHLKQSKLSQVRGFLQ